jgi:hypothetical protein
MGLASFVDGALTTHNLGQSDVALALACAAIDATAKRVYPQAKVGERYRAFLRENLVLVTAFGFPGLQAGGIRIKVGPNSGLDPKDVDEHDYTGIEAILYRTVRCGLVHECDIDTKIRFTKGTQIGDFDETFSLPAALILGLLAAVILHPVNADERSVLDSSIELSGRKYPLNSLWGKGFSWIRPERQAVERADDDPAAGTLV